MAQFREHISSAVGVNGANRPTDVAWIQAYLNMAPPGLGGPVADSGRRRTRFRGDREKRSGVKTNRIPG